MDLKNKARLFPHKRSTNSPYPLILRQEKNCWIQALVWSIADSYYFLHGNLMNLTYSKCIANILLPDLDHDAILCPPFFSLSFIWDLMEIMGSPHKNHVDGHIYWNLCCQIAAHHRCADWVCLWPIFFFFLFSNLGRYCTIQSETDPESIQYEPK